MRPAMLSRGVPSTTLNSSTAPQRPATALCTGPWYASGSCTVNRNIGCTSAGLAASCAALKARHAAGTIWLGPRWAGSRWTMASVKSNLTPRRRSEATPPASHTCRKALMTLALMAGRFWAAVVQSTRTLVGPPASPSLPAQHQMRLAWCASQPYSLASTRAVAVASSVSMSPDSRLATRVASSGEARMNRRFSLFDDFARTTSLVSRTVSRYDTTGCDTTGAPNPVSMPIEVTATSRCSSPAPASTSSCVSGSTWCCTHGSVLLYARTALCSWAFWCCFGAFNATRTTGDTENLMAFMGHVLAASVMVPHLSKCLSRPMRPTTLPQGTSSTAMCFAPSRATTR
mmetsp:Transcript_17954/g.37577  ORF Transcript_17954/g.37577 Transcript_17954/m.37577 type:complete len:344 (-) Transcript_17954:204-1235(-)